MGYKREKVKLKEKRDKGSNSLVDAEIKLNYC